MVPFAAAHRLRLVLVNMRDYPGSTPYTPAELAALEAGYDSLKAWVALPVDIFHGAFSTIDALCAAQESLEVVVSALVERCQSLKDSFRRRDIRMARGDNEY